MKNKRVLILTPFFSPNVGGVETHLDDLVKKLDDLGYYIFVQTYSPLTSSIKASTREKKGKNIYIKRYRWSGKNFFHKVEKFPILDFLYLTPYLFCRVFIWVLANKNRIDVIHAHGLNAALIGGILKKLFHKKLIVSIHAIYELDKDSKTAKRIVYILNKTDKVLCLSKGSYNELISFGLHKAKLDLFKHWIALNIFKPLNKTLLRNKLNIADKFTVLFAGRLIEKKGVKILVKVAKKLPQINFVFVGTGPEEKFLKEQERELSNLKFIGSVENKIMYKCYNIADLFCAPSQYEEGFGRSIIEAVACGLPVVGSNRGGIPEALDKSVSILLDPTVENIKAAIEKLYINKELYLRLSQNCRRYAETNFSEKNINSIIKYY